MSEDKETTGFYCSNCDEDKLDPEWDNRNPKCPDCGEKVTWTGIPLKTKEGVECLRKEDGEWEEASAKDNITLSATSTKQAVINHNEGYVRFSSGKSSEATLTEEELEFCLKKLKDGED